MGARTQELHFNRAAICYSVNYSRSKLIILLWSDFGWGTLNNLQTNQMESSGSWWQQKHNKTWENMACEAKASLHSLVKRSQK